MYNPPSKRENWKNDYRFHQCSIEYFDKIYNEGYHAAENGKKLKNNPHKSSGHERDTTFDDEKHYWWDEGFDDYFIKGENESVSKIVEVHPPKYSPPTWDEFFMRHVYLVASKSKDDSTKIGAVLVRDNTVISEGYNGICRKVNDGIVERNQRPEKYFWYEHGERNSVYNAARNGIKTLQSTLYTQACPCCDCARSVLQAGIKEIVLHKQWEDHWKVIKGEKWIGQDERSLVMFKEANIPVRYFNGVLDISCRISENWYKL